MTLQSVCYNTRTDRQLVTGVPDDIGHLAYFLLYQETYFSHLCLWGRKAVKLQISKHSALKVRASRWLFSPRGWRGQQEVVNSMCPNCHLLSRSLARICSNRRLLDPVGKHADFDRSLFPSIPLPSHGRDVSFPASIHVPLLPKWASLLAQMVKNLSAMQEMWVQSLGWEAPLEKGMATHSSILAWRIPRTEEPGGLQCTELQRVWHDWATNTHFSSKAGEFRWSHVP